MTTVSDDAGRRAGYVRYVLDLMERSDIPYAAGADVASGYYRYALDYPPEIENWPDHITPQPGSPDKAVILLKQSIEQGAINVGIVPWTNFMLLEHAYPGILKQATLFLMGGFVFDIPAVYPQWSTEDDYNVKVDISSARVVLERANPTLVPITVSCQTALRRAYLPRLAQAGRLGELIVRQAALFAQSEQLEQFYGESCSGLPWGGTRALRSRRSLSHWKHERGGCMRFPRVPTYPHAWSRKSMETPLMTIGVTFSVVSCMRSA